MNGHAAPVRLEDIAAKLGVSKATVSKVLNGKPGVSDTTRVAVEKALRTSGYSKWGHTPPQSKLISIVFRKIDAIWALDILQGAQEACAELGYQLVIEERGHDNDPRLEWVDHVVALNPVGVLMVFSEPTPGQGQLFASHSIPYVAIDPSSSSTPQTHVVRVDNWRGGLDAGQHLAKLGHRRIAAITGPTDVISSQARFAGFRAALEEAGIRPSPEMVGVGNFNAEDGRRQALRMLSLPEPPTAIFAENDLMAMSIYEAARIKGVRIPEDLSVIGFDDIQTARLMGPSLTTVRQPLRDMAATGIRTIARLREGKDAPHAQVLPTQLIVRDSTCAPGH